VAVLIAGLDDFRVFNDIHGHLDGDRLLCLCADLVRETTRAEDTLARYAGDEFAIIMPDTTLQRGLLAAERIRSRIERDARLMVEGQSLGPLIRWVVENRKWFFSARVAFAVFLRLGTLGRRLYKLWSGIRGNPSLQLAHITVSLGVAIYPEHATKDDALISAADKALYVAKRLGKNQVRAAGDPGYPKQPV
jgi:GGDEF domain-containing protein